MTPTTVDGSHQQGTTVAGMMNGGQVGTTTTVVPQPMTATAIQAQPAQPAAPPRAPSPIFVSVPPRTSRVLHSEIYQK